ncbi:hypothetical protein D3C72_1074850 [compost metagenome]
MSNNFATRRALPWVVGALLLTTMAACNNQAPGSASPNGGGAGQTAGQGPVAAPGLGVNPGNLTGAPAPAGAASGGAVQLNDPANFPFIDPVAEKATDLFFNGQWGINGGYIEQAQGARRSSLTFRQYAGGAFGTPNGVAPAKYRADVSVWVYQPSAQYPDMVGAPLGILGYAPYFISETRYLLVVAKPKTLEAWVVDGQSPGTEWPLSNRVWKQDLATELAVGAPVTWSVEVDTNAKTAKIWANGEEKTTVTHPMLTNAGQRVALVSNGNFVHFQDLKLYGM